jgi:signal transduction histidine kinase
VISGKSILLVEDNPGDSRLIREMLADVADSKVEVVVAETLADGLRAARGRVFDAMLLDLSLPDSAGLDTLRAARVATPAVPIIVLTGREDDDLAAAAVGEGAQDYLVKGHVDGEMLARSIRYAIERKRAERDLAEYYSRLESVVAERTIQLTRANNRLVAATEAKSRFLASMSHELRTPLNSIIGFSGVLQQGLSGPLTPEQSEQVGFISGSGKQLLGLINNVLDIARIESGMVEVSKAQFPIGPFVRTITDSIRPLADAKGLALEMIVNREAEQTELHTDPERVGQVLLNLLSNAVKFTEEGTVTLEVGLPDPRDAAFVVRDTGVGILDTDLKRVFEEFEQVAVQGMTPRGTGLGLAISRELAGILGGSLSVSSTPGTGSTFTLLIPRSCPAPASSL